MKKKKRLIIFGTLLGLLGLGVINAALYWDSGYASKDISFSEDSEDAVGEAFDIVEGGNLFGNSSYSKADKSSSSATHKAQQIRNAANEGDVGPEESESLFSDIVPVSTGGGMTQQGGTIAGTSSNSGSYSGGYTRHADDNGVWNSLKPTSSASESSSASDPSNKGDSGSTSDPEVNSIDEGGPTSVPDGGTTVWMLGLSLLSLSLFVRRYRPAQI